MIGSISSATDMASMMQTQQARPPKPPEFSDIDTNGDGGIDKTEFLAAGEGSPMADKVEENIDEIFSMLDSDGDGVLSESEAAEMPQKIGEYMQTKFGMAPPPMKPPEEENEENSLILQALENYEKNSEEWLSSLVSTVDLTT